MRHEILYVDLFLFEKIIYNFYKTFLTTTRERASASRLRKKMSAMERQALKSKLGGLPPMPPPGVG